MLFTLIVKYFKKKIGENKKELNKADDYFMFFWWILEFFSIARKLKIENGKSSNIFQAAQIIGN